MPSKHISQVRRWVLQSPPAEWALNRLRELLIGALRQGPIPKHVAFVMDGNRRFAKNHRIETVEGHNLGFEALARILEVCYKSGVTHVTIYAFSIENFKRSKYEVDALMDMAMIKLRQMLQHGDLLDRYGARIRVLGEKSFINAELRQAIDKAEKLTAKNDKAVLNVCFPYTSRDEITTAIRTTVEEWSVPISQPENRRRSPFQEERISNTIRAQGLVEQSKPPPSTYLQAPGLHSPSSSSTSLTSDSALSHSPSEVSVSSSSTLHGIESPPNEFTKYQQTPNLAPTANLHDPIPLPLSTSITSEKPSYPNPESITPEVLTQHMYTHPDPPLDLLIRTSGVERLSDFMLWQCHETTEIVFLKCLWPEFDLWHFLPAIWEWQWRRRREERAERERREALPGSSAIKLLKVD